MLTDWQRPIRKAREAQDTVISPGQSANAFWSEGDCRAVSAAEESRAAHLLSPEQNMEEIQEKQSFKMSTFTYSCITLPRGRALGKWPSGTGCRRPTGILDQ